MRRLVPASEKKVNGKDLTIEAALGVAEPRPDLASG